MATRSDGGFSVKTTGLAALNRDLRNISREMGKKSVAELKKIGEKVKADAVPGFPHRTGKTAASLKVGATGKGARIYSLLPQAPVIEYGGTIHPRGVPIKFKRTQAIGKAIKKDAPHIEEQLGQLLENIARANGFH